MRRWIAGAAFVLVLGGAVRLATVHDVLTASGVRLGPDTDPHYHVLRAERMLHGTPAEPWRDPALSWPDGAEVPWPPAFDVAIAGLARIAAPAPDRESLARAASVLPVLLGLGSLLVAAALARRLGAGGGWLAAAILAVLPAHAEYTVFGRATSMRPRSSSRRRCSSRSGSRSGRRTACSSARPRRRWRRSSPSPRGRGRGARCSSSSRRRSRRSGT